MLISNITFKYGTYNTVTVRKLDAIVDLTSHRAIELFSWIKGTGNNSGRIQSVTKARLKY